MLNSDVLVSGWRSSLLDCLTGIDAIGIPFTTWLVLVAVAVRVEDDRLLSRRELRRIIPVLTLPSVAVSGSFWGFRVARGGAADGFGRTI